MRSARAIGGMLITFVGVVWALQGFGASYVPTSFMTKAPEWIVIGIGTAAAGIYIAVRAITTSATRSDD